MKKFEFPVSDLGYVSFWIDGEMALDNPMPSLFQGGTARLAFFKNFTGRAGDQIVYAYNGKPFAAGNIKEVYLVNRMFSANRAVSTLLPNNYSCGFDSVPNDDKDSPIGVDGVADLTSQYVFRVVCDNFIALEENWRGDSDYAFSQINT